MTSVRCKSIVGKTTLLCAAFFLSIGTVSAQIASTKDSANSEFSSSTESSSNTLQVADDTGMPFDAALPALSAGGAGGGQYDNKSPRYGSGGFMSHLTYGFGGGFNAPTSDSAPYITWGWNFMAGAGYRFDKHFAANINYQYIHSKLPGAIIDQAGSTGGYATIWSFSLDPTYDINPKSAVEFYATGGYGFYRKVTNFTDPQAQIYCTYFYCGVITQDVVIGHFSSNQGGWSIGGGLQHRFAGWNGEGKMKVFAEARYLDVLSPAVTTEPNGLGTTTVGAGTKIIPVNIGLRW